MNVSRILIVVTILFAALLLGSDSFYYRNRADAKDLMLKEYQDIVTSIYKVDHRYSDLPKSIIANTIKEGVKGAQIVFVYNSENRIEDYFGIAIIVDNDKIINVELYKP